MRRTIAIVGDGASGTMAAMNLLREAQAPRAIVIVEPRERLGRGVAYSTTYREHLLNVPARGMSAFPDSPSHFLEWLDASGEPRAGPSLFAPHFRLIPSECIQAAYARSG
jgi:uncharacterized NAD(P)/FAD-binding protein YdhS